MTVKAIVLQFPFAVALKICYSVLGFHGWNFIATCTSQDFNEIQFFSIHHPRKLKQRSTD